MNNSKKLTASRGPRETRSLCTSVPLSLLPLLLFSLCPSTVLADTGYGESASFDVDNTQVGACCLSDESCLPDYTFADCASAGGVNWLPGEGCGSNPCETPPGEGEYFYGLLQWLMGSDADPVNTATGNFSHQETDLSIASRGRALVFARYYNSLDPNPGPLGTGWGHTWHIVVYDTVADPDADVAVRWADGHLDYWKEDGQGGYEPVTLDRYDELVLNGDSTWTLTATSLDVYDFDVDGKLTSITDKNGNTFTCAYNVDDKLETVTDPAGRALTLTYHDSGPESGLLESVSDFLLPTPRVVQYGYTDGRLTVVTDVLGNTVNYTYDGNGYLATITDQRGLPTPTLANTYDAGGRVLEQRDANDNPTTFDYGDARTGSDETTMVREVTVEGEAEPRSLETTHPYEAVYKRQLEIVNPQDDTVSYLYDDRYNRKSITDRDGNTTEFEYDEHGNVLSAIEADDPDDPSDGGTTAVAYGDLTFVHLPTQKTNALGNVTDWEYGGSGNVENEKRWLDAEQTDFVEKSWTYNGFGQRETETDERGNTHQWFYDVNGLLTEEIDREGNHTWYGYDDLWRRIWVTNGRGTIPEDPNYTTYYFYDDAGRLIRIEGPPVGDPPHSIVQWFGYDEIGNRTWVTDGNGTFAEDPDHTTYYEYDGNGNLTRVTDALGGQTQYAYDELNRKVKMADANGNLTDQYTRYEYDDADRLVEREDPEGNVWTYTYDAQGNTLTQTDPSGVTITHEYDALNRRVLTYDELGNQTHFEYDQLNRLVRQTDAEGNETDFSYDALGRLVCVVDAEGGWTQYTYDETGNLIEIEDAKDDVVSIREYDVLNRLIRAEDGNGNYYTYGYDEVGNQVWVIDANGQPTEDTTYLTYDAQNRLVQIDYPDATQVTYTYDDNGNRLTMTDEGTGTPQTSSFTYDELNRLESSTDSYGQTVGYSYDPVGNRISLTYPDSKEVTYGYDTANRLTTITDWADPARETAYSYNGMRIEAVTYPNGVVETLVYDVAGRLESMDTQDHLGAPLLGFTWVRDGVGNPTSVTETGTLQPTLEQLLVDYQYDTDNRLTTSSQGTYQHDPNGNLTARTVGGTTTTFTYDVEDRMVSQTTDASTVQHVYDGASQRIARDDGASEKRYVLDKGRSMSHVLCETDDMGTITAYYIHGPTIVARIDDSDVPHYYHTNNIGNVVALTAENEQITDRYGYTPFGLLRAEEGTTDNPFTYVGGLGVMAEADGLYFMRARFYDPDTGRFLGKDPVEGALTDPRGLHRYMYGLNSPVVLTDASGEIIPLVIVAAVLWGSTGGGASVANTGVNDLFDIFVHETRKQPRSLQQYVSSFVSGFVGMFIPPTFDAGIEQSLTEMLGATYEPEGKGLIGFLNDLIQGDPSEPLDPDTLLDIQGEMAQRQWEDQGWTSASVLEREYTWPGGSLGSCVGPPIPETDVHARSKP